jgi:hypothetical protein
MNFGNNNRSPPGITFPEGLLQLRYWNRISNVPDADSKDYYFTNNILPTLTNCEPTISPSAFVVDAVVNR